MQHSNTSHERVGHLVSLSHCVYGAQETKTPRSEDRPRHILKLSAQVVARTLESGYGSGLVAGEHYESILWSYLSADSPMQPALSEWPRYVDHLANVPRAIQHCIADTALAPIVERYADVKRATILRDGNYESDASHVVHLSALALPYAAQYYPDLDLGKVSIYCLIHDIVEAYAGDTPSFGISPEEYLQKDTREAEALARISAELELSYPRLVTMIHHYEKLTDSESRFVKTFDKLDPSFTHFENQGLSLRRDYKLTSGEQFRDMLELTTDRMQAYCQEFPGLMLDRRTLSELAIDLTWSK